MNRPSNREWVGAFERQDAEAKAKGEPVPKRANSFGIYGRPQEGAEVFNANRGE
jgi:hypothetical protein